MIGVGGKGVAVGKDGSKVVVGCTTAVPGMTVPGPTILVTGSALSINPHAPKANEASSTITTRKPNVCVFIIATPHSYPQNICYISCILTTDPLISFQLN
jgi:hypothetical protein